MPNNLAHSHTELDHSGSGVKSQWNACTALIKKEVTEQSYRTWILPIIPVSFVDGQLILRVPSQFFFEWIIANYQDIIYSAVKKVFGLRTHIDYLVASTPNHHPEEVRLKAPAHPEDPESTSGSEKEEPHLLDARYQFDNFLVANDNELALRAAEAVAKRPGKTDYNPLFIYGETGYGKTHLLTAVGNYVLSRSKRKKVRYLSAEHFISEYIYALQNKKWEDFANKFKNLDVLLLDNFQFLSGKKKSQETLFFFISELERQGKQIVVASNQAPAHLIGFEERLTSFFQKGLIVDLVPPSYQTRLKWIDTYCQKNEMTLPEDVREFLAQSLDNGLHQIRAVMVRIAAHSSLLRKPISLDATKRILGEIDTRWAKHNGKFRHIYSVKIEDIITAVSDYMEIPQDVLLGFSRKREISVARQIAIYLCKELSGESLQVIAYHFNDRHYTSIIHNHKKILKEIKANPMLNNIVSEIKHRILK